MKIKNYFHEVYTEMIHKVSWPTMKELQSSALIVMVASLLIALVIFVMDISFENLLTLIYKILG